MSSLRFTIPRARRLRRPALATLLVAGTLAFGTVQNAPVVSAAAVCASPPSTGTTTLSGVVNRYFPGQTAALGAGQASTTLIVGAGVGAGGALAADDLVLVIQMQGAQIDSTNTDSYGDGVAGGEARGNLATNLVAGQYEYARVSSVTGSTIGLVGSGANAGLVNSYQNSSATATTGQYRYQLIRVPQYSTAVISAATPPTARAWNGTTGGVVVFDAATTLDLNGSTIDVSGLGFRPGLQRRRSGATGLTNADYRSVTASAANGQKGEGIAGTPVWRTGDADTVGDGYPNGDFARGAAGNAGGGGTDGRPSANDENSGGGGGGNGGLGGRGGNSWNSNLPVGGNGGGTVAGGATRVVMGGGGGAGSDNDAVLDSSGGAGGGIVLIRSGAITGSGTISANGLTGQVSGQDGAGGAGAGGSVAVLTSATGAASGMSGLTINARGGTGGNEVHPSPHGPGGGGGGGRIVTTVAPAATNVAGGAAGIHTATSSVYGAITGSPGIVSTSSIGSVPGANTGSQCIDLTVTKTVAPTSVVPGQAVTYTVVARNQGPFPVTGTAPVVVTDPIPVALTGVTWTCSATTGSTCASSGSGSLSTTANLALNGVATYTITGTLSPTFTGTLANTATVAPPTGVPELRPDDNTATASAVATPRADLGITKTDGATVATPGTNVTYAIVVSNAGPSAVTNAPVTDALPVGASSGTWTCTPATGGTCGATSGSMPMNTTATIAPSGSVTYSVTVAVRPTATGSLVNTATVATPTGVVETNAADNQATDSDTFTPTGDLSITKTDGLTSIDAGIATSYTVVASNTGPSTVTAATVTDTLPAALTGATWSCVASSGSTCPASGTGDVNASITLASGGTATFTLLATVQAGAAGTISNTATVAGPLGFTDPTPANNSRTDTTTITRRADLRITKTDGATSEIPGTSVTYTIVASNPVGPSAIAGATVSDALPATLTGATWSCASTAGSACPASGTGTISAVVDLAVGGSATFTLTAAIASTATGTLANTATVAAPTGTTDPTPANNSATDSDTLTPTADLAITITDGALTEIPGTDVTYVVTATNGGPSSVAGSTVSVPLPASVSGATWTCLATGGAVCPAATGTGPIAQVVSLPPGGALIYSVTGTISRSATGTLVSPATISVPAGVTDPTPGNNSRTDTDTLTPTGDLRITKTDGRTSAVPGQAVSYTIVVTNPVGPSDMRATSIVDTIPSTIVGATWTCSAATGAACATSGGSGDVATSADVPVGGSVTIVVAGTVAAGATGNLTNSALVTAGTGTTDPDGTNNTATDVDTLDPRVDLVVVKDDARTAAVPGSSVTYTITVSNPTGPSDVAGATVTDLVPAELGGVSWTCSPSTGAVCGAIAGSGNISTTVDLGVGAVATFTATGTVSSTATGNLTNAASASVPTGVTETTPADNSDSDVDTLTPTADLSVTKTDGQTSAIPGTAVQYTIVVSNGGPSTIAGARVTDTVPAALTGASWTCVASSGSSCSASGSGNIDESVTVAPGGTTTFTLVATVSSSATGSLVNRADVALPDGATDPTPGNNTATDTDTLTPVADLVVVKDDDATTVVAGTATDYTVTVTNQGPSAVAGVRVSDAMPSELGSVAWSCSPTTGSSCPTSGVGDIDTTVDLASGGVATFLITATVASDATGNVVNRATATVPSGTTDPTPGDATDDDTDAIVVSHDLAITKTDGVDAAVPGAAVTYTIVVTNPTGPSAAVDAVVTDALPASVRNAAWTCVAALGGVCDTTAGTGDISATVDLPVGATTTFVVNATVDATATGTLANTAAVRPAPGSSDPQPGDNDSTDTDTLGPIADLTITKTDSRTTAVPGTAIEYTVVVSNAGPSAVVGATVTDTLPSTLNGATWTCSPTGAASCAASTGTGDIATTVDLGPGASAAFVVSTTLARDAAIAGPTLSNTASVSVPSGVVDPSGPNSATDTDDLMLEADLVVTKDDGVTSATPGGAVTYTITASNPNGPSDVVGARVDDTFASAVTSTAWTCSATGGAACGASGSGDISELVDLPVDGVVTFTVVAAIDPSATGVLSNDATVSVPAGVTDTLPANNLAHDSDTLTPDVDLSISKSDGQTTAVPGSAITYTILVTNGGDSDVVGARVTDTVPGTLTAASWTCVATAGSTCAAAGPGSIDDVVDVRAGATLTYTLTGRLDPAATGTLDNTARVALPSPLVDPTPATNSSTDSDVITPVADLSITKSDSVDAAAPGSAVTYTVVVSNDGPSDVTGATVTDPLPTGVDAFAWSCSGADGGSCSNASGTGAIIEAVDLPSGSSVAFLVTAAVSTTASGSLVNTAAVAPPTGTTDPGPGPNSATDSDVLGPVADLSVTKTDGVDDATPGRTTTYTIVVSNAGPSPAPGTRVVDAVPSGVTAMSWSCTPSVGAGCAATTGSGTIDTTVDLPATGSATFDVTVDIDPAAVGTLVNTVDVTPGPGVGDPDSADDRTATDSDALVADADLSITKTDGATSSIPGQSINYTIVVRNDGPSAVTDAAVVDALPVALIGATWTCTATTGSNCDLADGTGDVSTTVDLAASGEATFVLVADIDPNALGTLSNTAGVSPPTGVTDPDSADRTATDVDTLAPTADLSITKTDGRTAAAPLDATTYTIVVANSGDSAVVDAPVSDTLPADLVGATWTCTNGVGGNCDDVAGSGDIATTVDLSPSGSVTFTVVGTIAGSASGTLSNSAIVTAPSGVTDPTPVDTATDETTITPTAELSITKTDGRTVVVAGERTTYTIVVSNAGPSTVLDLDVADDLPATLSDVDWTCVAEPGANCDLTAGTGDIATSVDLGPDTSVTFTVDALLDAAATGQLANTATITPPTGLADTTTADHTATDTDTITPRADLAITKDHGTVDSAPGAAITYTVVVGNTGPSDVLDARVTDTMPTDLSSVTWACVAAGGAVCDDPSGSDDISTTVDVPVGATTTFTIRATIDPDATGTLTNSATVAVPTGVVEVDPANNAASDPNRLTPAADLSITKTDGATSVVAGTSVEYTIVATNPGPSTIRGATVTDTPPATLTDVSWTCTTTTGSTCSASGTGSITDSVDLAVAGSATYVLRATVSPSATGSVTNRATVALPDGAVDPTPGENVAIDTDTITRTADVSITKDDSTTTAVPGGTTTYTIVATNPVGPSDVVGARVTDAFPAGATAMSWTCAASGGAACATSGSGAISELVDLPVGGAATFTVAVSIAPGATGSFVNTATLDAPAGVTDADPLNDSATDRDTLAPSADIVVTNSDGVTSAIPGTNTTYRVTVSNVGPSAAPGTVVSFGAPTGASIVAWSCADDGASTCADPTGTGAIATSVDLAPGSSVTYTITVAIDQGATGTLETLASATPAMGIVDPTPANNSASDVDTLTPTADLSITKTDGVTSAVPGDDVTYTIVVSNAGPSGVVAAPVVDPMPSTLLGVGWSCSATAGSACADTLGTGDISSTVDLLSGGSATFVVDATIAPTATGTLENTARVDVPTGVVDPDPATDRSATDSDTLTPTADLSITKTDGVTAVAPLQSTTYTVVVTNSGPSAVADAVVVDQLPTDLVGATWTCADGTDGTCDVASGSGDVLATVDLGPTGSVTFTITATVAAGAGGTISNTASVTAPSGTIDPTPVDRATDDSAVTPVADLSITKTDGLASASSGQVVTYTIVAANAGPSWVVGARVLDDIPTTLSDATWLCSADVGAACSGASGAGSIDALVDLAANTSVTFSVTATIAAVDGTVLNAATLSAPTGTTDPDAGNDRAEDTTIVDPVGNLSITKTDGRSTVTPGTATSYTIVVTNDGPSNVTGVEVGDVLPATLVDAHWTCAASIGAVCHDANGTDDVATTVDLDAGATATFVVGATVAPDATGTISNTATLVAPPTYTDADPSDDSAADATATAPVVDLAVTKSDNRATAVPGTSVTYTIAVTNAGPSTATDARVIDALPPELTDATWTCSATTGAVCPTPSGAGSIDGLVTVAPASTVTFVLTADVSFGATGRLTNTATVGAPTGSIESNSDDDTSTDSDDLTPQVDLAVVKSDGAVSVTPGNPTAYTIVVTNAGPSSVSGARVADVLGSTLTSATWTCAASVGSSCPASGTGDIDASVDLAAGATATFTLDAIVAGDATGTVTNTATVTPPDGVLDTDDTNDSSTDTSSLAPVADLSITKTDGVTVAVPGTPLRYTIVATNDGPSAVVGASIVDTLPAALTGASWTCSSSATARCAAASGVGDVDLDADIAVGGQVTIVVDADVVPTASGLLVNSATISTPAGVSDPDPDDNTATDIDDLAPSADLSITKSDGLSGALPGDTTVYAIVVADAGPSAVTAARVVDTIPPELTNVSWTCTASNGSTCGASSGNGDIDSTVDLAVSGSATFTVTADVVATVTGTVANSATVSVPAGVTDPDPANNAASDSTTISPLADVSITKTDGLTTVVAGSATKYSVVVTNPGPSDLSGVRVLDRLPAALTAPTWTCVSAGGATCAASGSGSIDQLVDMPASSTVTFTVDATVAPAASGTISNTASVELPAGVVDPTPTNDTATDATLVEGVADLSITKTDGVASAIPGTPITYVLVASNDGPSDATGARITDVLPAALTAGTQPARWVCTTTGAAACTTGSGTGAVDTLVDIPHGDTVTIAVTATIASDAAGQLSNTAVITPSAGTTDPDLDDNAATDVDDLRADVDLAITIDDGVSSVVPGTTTTYIVTVANRGPSDAVGAVVRAALPASIAGATWTSTGPTASGSGDISDTVDLPVGATITYTIIAVVPPTTRGTVSGVVSVVAPIGANELDPGDNAAIDTDTLTPTADLAIAKSDGRDSIGPRDVLSYTITVTNAGPSSVVGAAVTDEVPAALGAVSWTCVAGAGSRCAAPAGTGSIATAVDLAVDGVITFVLDGTVADGAAGDLVNSASVSVPGDTTDPNGSNDVAVDIDPVIPEFELAISKVADSSVVASGDALGYTIVVTNAGPSTAVGVVVEDRLPTGLVAGAWSCSGANGAVCAITAGSGAPVVSVDVPADGVITIRLATTVVADLSADPSTDSVLVNVAAATAVAAVGSEAITTQASASVTIVAPDPLPPTTPSTLVSPPAIRQSPSPIAPTPAGPAPTPSASPPSNVASAVIPRTGGEPGPLLLAAGLILALGAAMFGAASRSRRRTTH